MKHIYILTILVSIFGYSFAMLFAKEFGDTWGYLQWGLLSIAGPVFTIATLRSWFILTREE